MIRSRTIAVAAGFVAAGLLCALAASVWLASHGNAVATARHPRWAEVQWPFAMDEWGQGKAFRCGATDCGAEVSVYIRPKIGFCNCTTGVSDDAELDRLSDFNLVGGRVTAISDGHPIAVGWMRGRSRAFTIDAAGEDGRSTVSAAFNNGCDAIVASAIVDRERLDELEPQVIAFLNSGKVLQWAKTTLGLKP
jgi:hypothetical protein